MRLLTLKINEKKDYIINFRKDIKNIRQYIISGIGDYIPLIKFFNFKGDIDNGVVFQNSEGRTALFIESLTSTSVNRSEEDGFCCIDTQIVISLSKIKTDNKDANLYEDVVAQSDGMLILTPEGMLKFKNRVGYSQKFSIKFLFDDSQHNLNILYGSTKQIVDVVLDFGSEASQMLLQERDEGATLNSILPIFSRIKNQYINQYVAQTKKSNPEIEVKTNDEAFLQYSSDGNKGLYLSKFLIPRKIEQSLITDSTKKASSKPMISEDKGDLLKFMVGRDMVEQLDKDYMSLPNIKISNFGGYQSPYISINCGENKNSMYINDVKENFFYRSALNFFVYQALEEIKNINFGNNNIRFVSLLILMPNVYTYNKISENIDNLITDITEILNSDREKYGCIEGFEVSVVSESDASLLGALEVNANQSIASGNYLIMDAGKGTLDFSIINYDADASDTPAYQNLCRSGIIGAGNAISYSILLSFLYNIVQNGNGNLGKNELIDTIQSIIYDNILGLTEKGKEQGGGDEKHLFDLTDAIESYKRNLNNNEKLGLVNLKPSNESDFHIEGLINGLKQLTKNNVKVSDDLNIVQYFIDSLVDMMFEEIDRIRFKDINIDHFICAGRAFLFKPLKDAVVKRLKSEFPDCTEKTYITEGRRATQKNICLYIANTIKNGKYNTNVIGTPFLIDEVPENQKGKRNRDEEGSKLSKFFSSIFSSIIVKKGSENAFTPGQITYHAANEQKYPLVDGYSFKSSYRAKKVNIGGTTYILPSSIPSNTPIEIFFDGEEYFIRHNKNVDQFDNNPDLNATFVLESIFPYCNNINKGDIPVYSHLLDRENSKKENKKEMQNGDSVASSIDGVEQELEKLNKLKGE